MRFFSIIVIAVVLFVTCSVSSAPAEIIWHEPLAADDGGGVIYEEGPYAVVPELAPVIREDLPPPKPAPLETCALADNPFALSLIASRARLPDTTAAAARPLIAIVIDDMGVDKKRSAAVIQLAGPLTLAYLPYPKQVQAQVDMSVRAGHGIMMHVPMQPEKTDIDAGPDALRADVGVVELERRILANLDAFIGYSGVNNHMGSRFTQDRMGLDLLMRELDARGLFFLDSKTHPRSVGEVAALAAGVPAAHRDVFLDHVETPAAVAAALAATEKQARRHGSAIAIGHPKDVTIAALKAWLPQVKDKGFELVTIEELISRRQSLLLNSVSAKPTP